MSLLDLATMADYIKLIAMAAGVVVCGYAGLVLMVSSDTMERGEWKEILLGAITGLVILFLAPVIASAISGWKYCA